MSDKQPAMIPGVFVRSKGESFRRCGFTFDKSGTGIALEALTEDALARLRAEPALIVEDAEFPAAPEADGLLAAQAQDSPAQPDNPPEPEPEEKTKATKGGKTK